MLVDGNNVVAKCTHVSLSVMKERGSNKATYRTAVMTYSPMLTAVRMIRDFAISYQPDMILFVTDDGIPSFRRKLVPTYKRGREERREKDESAALFYDVYKEQMNEAPAVLLPLGIHMVSARGFEADDVIGACVLVRYRKEERMIFSEDRDFMQLVGKDCKLYRPSAKKVFAERPTGYLLLRAMWGDASDNIVGVPKIGEVRATRIVEEHSTDDVDEFMSALDPADKYEQMVLEHGETVRNNVKVMDLCRTAKKADKALRFTQGVLDKKEFVAACKRLKMRDFLEAPTPIIMAFEQSNNFFGVDE